MEIHFHNITKYLKSHEDFVNILCEPNGQIAKEGKVIG